MMTTTEVEFTTEYFLRCWEDRIALVGGASELGNWFPTAAPFSQATDGKHLLILSLPSDVTYEFKWAVLNKSKCSVYIRVV